LSEPLQLAIAIAASALAAVGLLAPQPRWRAVASVAALALAGVAVLGQAWDGELSELRSRPPELALLLAVTGAGVVGLAFAFRRWPDAFPLAALAALPLRIPVDVGGDNVNLLLPLYVVIAAGLLTTLVGMWRDPPSRRSSRPRILVLALAGAVVAYGLQSIYSNDAEFAVRNIAFFLVPFATLFALLSQVEWRPRLLVAALSVVIAEAVAFALVGVVQHQIGELFWNDNLISSNDFHFYFRANSVFWDPNIYGRYLAVAIVLALAALVWSRGQRPQLLLSTAIAAIWVGLLLGFSQTSFFALLVGVAVVSALSWSLKWTLLAAPLVAAAVIVAILAGSSGDDQRGELATESSGHSTLIEGGLRLAAKRPLYGYGSASFPVAFRENEDIAAGRTTVSHNEPVTVAAEQGVVGVAIYLALLVAALLTLFGGLRAVAPGIGGGAGEGAEPESDARVLLAARIGLAAAFCALLMHTIGYAGYLTDPLTWALLAVSAAISGR
jgi:O-antigen ligase